MQASKQVLVVYYSLSGNTARVASDLAARLGADLESIDANSHIGCANSLKWRSSSSLFRRATALSLGTMPSTAMLS